MELADWALQRSVGAVEWRHPPRTSRGRSSGAQCCRYGVRTPCHCPFGPLEVRIYVCWSDDTGEPFELALEMAKGNARASWTRRRTAHSHSARFDVPIKDVRQLYDFLLSCQISEFVMYNDARADNRIGCNLRLNIPVDEGNQDEVSLHLADSGTTFVTGNLSRFRLTLLNCVQISGFLLGSCCVLPSRIGQNISSSAAQSPLMCYLRTRCNIRASSCDSTMHAAWTSWMLQCGGCPRGRRSRCTGRRGCTR